MVREFTKILFSQSTDDLDWWLDAASEYTEIPDLISFVNDTKSDIIAVKNTIRTKYNNGLAEGSVNKIKLIKRTMYGRNDFDLLRSKVLLHEHFYSEIT